MTSRTWLLAAAAIAALAVPGLRAQSAAAPARFEVAAIKPSQPGADGSSRLFDASGRFTTENSSLKELVQFAWQVQDFRISGGPPWINSDRYDILAKPEPGTYKPEQRMQMVQGLLADRFRLKLHRETKESTVYLLVVAKSGPKMRIAESPLHGIQGGRGTLTGKGTTASALAAVLSRRLGRTVIDRTGLTGAYDFTLQFNPDESQPVDADSNPGPSIFTALQEQLGLKLESGKGPVEVLVIDRAEKPGEN